MRIALATLVVTASSSLALAQSWTATTGTTQPATTAPASNLSRVETPKSKIPPPANSKTRGIHVGKDAMDAGPLEIKRNK